MIILRFIDGIGLYWIILQEFAQRLIHHLKMSKIEVKCC